MRNVWKGFIIGSAVGTGIGVLLDSGTRAKRRIVEAGQDVDVGAKAAELRDRAAKSDLVQSAAERAREAARSGADVLHQANEVVSDAAANLGNTN